MRILSVLCLLILSSCSGGSGGSSAAAPATPTTPTTPVTEDSLSTVVRCFKVASGLSFEYVVNNFSSGDKYITCSVAGGSIQVFQSVFYKSTFSGYATEGCLLVSDADATPTSGYWTFSKNSGTRTAVYSDSGSGVNGTTITYNNTTECTTYSR